MTYYLLPKTNSLFYKYIDCITSDTEPTPIISNSLSCYLYEIKEELEKIEKDWDIFKKYTNPYEYIHSIIPYISLKNYNSKFDENLKDYTVKINSKNVDSNIYLYKKKCISKYKPLSRSYFKMIEMLKIFDFIPIKNQQETYNNQCKIDLQPIKTFHLAEGPGGFIEAIAGIRKCSLDQYIGMTIIDNNNDPNIPSWKKSESFLKKNKNVYIEKGVDNTGNILSLENFEYCKNKYASKIDLITADGGFDFSIDFNRQEINIAKLLFAQLSFAVIMQKKGGTFILKIFDSFMQHTIDILFILSSFYEKVYIIKPQTSRYANSEKYIICKGFFFSKIDNYYSLIYNAFEKMLSSQQYIHRFINIHIPISFIVRLEEYNAIFGQQQIENIYYTLSLIKNKNKQDKIDNLIKINIQKCILWCIKYNIPYHQIHNDTNIFLENEESNYSLV